MISGSPSPHGSRSEPPAAVLRFPEKLYGRERNAVSMLRIFEHVCAGHGAVLTVPGHSGVGKTALVRRLRAPVEARNGFFLVGKFDQYRQHLPYFALQQALSGLSRSIAQDDEAQRQRWRAELSQAVDGLGGLLTALAPEFEVLLGKQPPVADISPLEARHRFATVIRALLKTVCRPEHPVVLFVDDWQWADAASLDLLTKLEVGSALRYLLLVASYRDNEVEAHHPLTATLAELHRLAVPLERAEVRNLPLEEVRALLADTLLPRVCDLDGLAALAHRRTGGNPFFLRALIPFLHQEGRLRFHEGSWHWDVDQDGEDALPSDVTTLYGRQLEQLDTTSRELLSQAACLGNRFDVETLAMASGASVNACRERLQAAVDSDLLTPPEHTGASEFQFRHDRIQQAAYQFIPPAGLPAARLHIGRMLWRRLSPGLLHERLFEVAGHLNAGGALVKDRAERLRLAALNVQAARKAWGATAYRAMLQFSRHAAQWAGGPDAAQRLWREDSALARQLFLALAESEFLEGDRATAERCLRAVVAHARNPLEKAEALSQLIVQFTLLARYPEAIAAGREALAGLGVLLPEDHYETARDAEIRAVRQRLAGRSVAGLLQLPEMSDPVQRITVQLLITMGPRCYRSHQRLWSVIVPKVVGLTLQHGHVPQVGYSHIAFGGLLGWVANDYATARDFADLATALMTGVFASPSDQSVFYLMMGSSLRHWFEPLSAGSRDYALAYECGLRSGNLQYAAYAFGHNMYCRFYQGTPLAELIREAQASLVFSRTRTNQWAIDLLEGGLKIFASLAQSAADEAPSAAWEIEYLHQVASHHNIQVECIYRVLRACSLLLLGRNREALVWADSAQPLIYTVGTQGLLPWPEHLFARFLILTGLPDQLTVEQRAELDGMLAQLRIWADHCPANFAHKHDLAAAELARLDGRATEAVDLYRQAIATAAEGGFSQWEGLAHEREALFWESLRQDRLAGIHWQQAYGCYHRWGAARKLQAMEAAHRGQLLQDVQRLTHAGFNPLALQDEFQQMFLRQLRQSVAERAYAEREREALDRAEELARATASLRVEMAERRQAEDALRQHRENLELMVRQRTAELETSNRALAAAHAEALNLMRDTIVARDRAETHRMALQESLLFRREAERIARIGAWKANADTGYFRCTEGVNGVLGVPIDRTLTLREAFSYCDAASIPPLLAALQATQNSGAPFTIESSVTSLDGRQLWVEMRGLERVEEDGQVYVIGTMQDVTARKQAGQEREKLLAQLAQAQKMESIGRLAGGVSHDFNNLLMVINGYANLLLDTLPPGDPIRGRLDEIRKAGDRAAELTSQLLAFSRKQPVRPQPLDLNGLILDSHAMFSRLLGEDIEIVTQLDPELGLVTADPGQLHQVLLNLVVNARDAMATGGRLTIRTFRRSFGPGEPAPRPDLPSGPYIILEISDTGTGMSEDVREKIFEPFFTTKEQGAGTGLGLSTVYGIVQQAGGWVRVESRPGAGASFRIGLPLVQPSHPPPVAAHQLASGLEGSGTVLVVEDMDQVRALAVAQLRNLGYRTLEARSGGDALNLAEAHPGPIHLLLTDVIMPGGNGRELAGALRLIRPQIKVLYMSGYPAEVLSERSALELGSGYLPKPFTREALARKLSELLVDHRPPARVLVVDDSPSIRRFLTSVLLSEGFHVEEAEDGDRALAALESAPFDLVLTDLVMPNREGIETIAELRRRHPELKIVAISGAFGGNLLTTALALGANATLTKPVTPQLLLETVRQILNTPGQDIQDPQ